MVLIHNNFAQLTDFEQKTEDYSFDADFYLHCGSVLVGTKTNVVVKCRLRINDRPVNLNLLKNIKVVLTTHNYIDNLPVTKTFNDLHFNDDKELVLPFLVPTNLNKIDVLLNAEIVNTTTKKIEKFE